MGRSPCCDKEGLKKGPWTPEEDQKLVAFIKQHGHGSWRALPVKAGLQRCGKSCRLRWINYLRPDIKRGKFTLQEEQTIVQLHALLGNRWSAIATYLPKRTDNEIKNYWNTHLKKRLTKMGIDPMTHKPKAIALGSAAGQSKDVANLSHMAQWENARLEAESRLVKESKTHKPPQDQSHQLSSTLARNRLMLMNKTGATPRAKPQCLDVLKAWQGVVSGMFGIWTNNGSLESPTSILNFPENTPTAQKVVELGNKFVGNSLMTANQMVEEGIIREKLNDPVALLHEMTSAYSTDGGTWFQDLFDTNTTDESIIGGLSEMFACESSGDRNHSVAGEKFREDYGGSSFEEKNCWSDSMVDLVNASSAWSSVF